ncbi:MAG TPA: DUF3467 domain-containing protein [Bryobacteraceae bacterium]|nr:DUF3467 domain-containing protein [Bryobacteraceae bacterium]HUO31642.1 DUF3467 domain-containing protein [Bryobacteraceae bacterium]
MSDEKKEQQPKLEYVVPDPEGGIFTTYTNNIQLGFTHFDLRMLFGELVEATPERVVIEQRVQVTISYLQAKLLMLMLAQAIGQHEKGFGEVKIPDELLTFNSVSATAAIPPGVSARSQQP